MDIGKQDHRFSQHECKNTQMLMNLSQSVRQKTATHWLAGKKYVASTHVDSQIWSTPKIPHWGPSQSLRFTFFE